MEEELKKIIDKELNTERMEIIIRTIGMKKHGNDFEGYVDMWKELWNDDKDEIENTMIAIQEKTINLLKEKLNKDINKML